MLKYKDITKEYTGLPNTAPCPYFGQCGGCMFQDKPIDEQRALKQRYLSQVLADYHIDVPPLVGGPELHYRNRMDFIYAFYKLGQKKYKDYKSVVELENCLLLPPASQKVFIEVRRLLKEHNIQSYTYLSNKGYLRYVVIRQGYYSEQVMVSFVINSEDDTALQPVIQSLLPKVTSIIVSSNMGEADTSQGTPIKIYGQDHIIENLGNVKFKISVNSFFQSNSTVTLALYTKLRSYLKPTDKILDLYSGVGSISLFCAEEAPITGIELIESAVAAANENKTLNGLDSANFIAADVLDYLRSDHGQNPDTIIIDPPRSGIHPKALKRILELKPKQLIYVSCNPDTLAQDLMSITKNYKIDELTAYDMFPQTYHLETLVKFSAIS